MSERGAFERRDPRGDRGCGWNNRDRWNHWHNGGSGTTGTTGETAAAPKFVLTDATASAPAPAAGAASTTETPASSPASSAANASGTQTFRLIANSTALSPHVGKKLELTGTLEDQSAATTASESSPGSEAKTASLRVESGKVVGECSK